MRVPLVAWWSVGLRRQLEGPPLPTASPLRHELLHVAADRILLGGHLHNPTPAGWRPVFCGPVFLTFVCRRVCDTGPSDCAAWPPSSLCWQLCLAWGRLRAPTAAAGTGTAAQDRSALAYRVTPRGTAPGVRTALSVPPMTTEVRQLYLGAVWWCVAGTCPAGAPWTGKWSSATAHNVTLECSGQGVCNHVSGTCACASGFYGLACERCTALTWV